MPRRLSELGHKLRDKVRQGARRMSQGRRMSQAGLSRAEEREPVPSLSLALKPSAQYGTTEFFQKYGKCQQAGARIRRWMDDENEPLCPIEPCMLTFGTFLETYPDAHPIPHVPDVAFKEQICALGLPNEWDNPVEGSIFRRWAFEEEDQGLVWHGSTGPGFIIIEEIQRTDKTAPPTSHIAQAFYERNFALTGPRGLKTIFVSTVLEDETDLFVRNFLYTAEAGLDWEAGPPAEPQTWTYGTREFDGLLGTRIGKSVAYIILGAFPRGTRRIVRIITWPQELGAHVHMRFDIEEIE